MSFFSSMAKSTVQNIHDGAIKTIAQWNPDLVGESQIEEWNSKANELATMAAKAASDFEAKKSAVKNIQTDIDRYSAAAEKLADSNPDAANRAADRALELNAQLETANQELADADAWAKDTMASARAAQEKVVQGRAAIENAKHEQARALQAKQIAEQRLADRERLAGITHGLSGTDVAIDALRKNADAAKQAAAAANIRSNVLNKSTDTDDVIDAALAEVDGKPKAMSLKDKLAALKTTKVAE